MLRLVILLPLATTLASAQTTVHASLGGRVSDPTGAAVEAASMTLTSAETQGTYRTLTAADGSYLFARILPGRYTLAAEKPGFERVVREGLLTSISFAAVADLRLRLGDVASTVTVVADTSPVQSQSSSVSLLMDEARIKDLPLNSRDFQKLLFLAPGVGGQRSNNGATNNSSSGSRDLMNNYVIDGVSANEERQTAGLSPGVGGHGNLRVPNVISTEAIREFRIVTANADATFGRSSGAQINVVTRSGTNEYHGSLYEYWRNDALDARDFFNRGPFFNSQGRAKVPPFNQNQFGGSFGGPIRKNRHFFFGNYEGFRQRLQDTAALTLPTADLVKLVPGDLGRLFRTYFFDLGVMNPNTPPAGTVVPFAAADRNAAVAAGFSPALFDGNAANGEAGNLLASLSSNRDYDQNSFLVRTDHIVTDRWSMNFRYADAIIDRGSSTGNLPGTYYVSDFGFRSFVAQSTHTLTQNQVFEVRGGLLRGKNQIVSPEAMEPYYALGINREQGLGITLQGLTFRAPLATADPSWLDNQMTTQGAALHTWTRGAMTLRSGLDIRRINLNFGNMSFQTPSYTFAGLVGTNGVLGSSAASAQATALTATATLLGQNGGPATPLRGWRSTQQEYFTQLDWRLFPRLTLNLGLRYSDFGVYDEVNGYFSNLYALGQGGEVVPDANPLEFGRLLNRVEPSASGRPLYQPDRNNFQPRAGIAWALNSSGRTVVRAAYGLYNDRVVQLGMSNMTLNPPYSVNGSINNLPFRLGQPIPITPQIAAIFAIDPTLRSPQVHRINATIEQQLGPDTTISAGFVGTWGRNLVRYIEPNVGSSFPQNLRPDTRYGWQRIYGNYSTSEYESLQIVARRRFSRGLTFTSTYTYSQFLDDASADAEFASRATLINLDATPAPGIQGGTRFAERPIKADYGSSELETPHVFTMSALWDLPFGRGRRFLSGSRGLVNGILGGWSLSSIVVLRNGTTYNVTTGADYNDDGAFDDRPALAPGTSLGSLRGVNPDKSQYLVPQAEAQRLLVTPASVTDPFATIGRMAFRSPAVYNFDVSAIKHFAVTERVAMRFEANCFNLPNKTHLALPNGTLSSALFGRITSTVATTTPRQFQLGAKLTF
jgi:hypothetical protein